MGSEMCIRDSVKAIVNALRSGRTVQSEVVNGLRQALVTHAGWHQGSVQQDADELFAVLLDAMCAPHLSLVKSLKHKSVPDDASDHTPFTERMLWLNVPGKSGSVSLNQMIGSYFYGEVVHGLRRHGRTTDATVSRSLIPEYTPIREMGESSSATASRSSFAFLTVPFAISRFSADGLLKVRSDVHIPTAIAATRYVGPFGNGLAYTLILRSVICHVGKSLRSGHYIAYTYSPGSRRWNRWDDMDNHPIKSVPADTNTGEPTIAKWAKDIRRNSYLVSYELVPGEDMADARASARQYDDAQRQLPNQMDLDRCKWQREFEGEGKDRSVRCSRTMGSWAVIGDERGSYRGRMRKTRNGVRRCLRQIWRSPRSISRPK